MAPTVHVDARYTADTTQYVRQVRQAQQATVDFARSMPQADKSMADVKASTVALGSALGMLGAQALTRATAKVKQFAMQGVNAAKDYEQTVISIEGIFAGMGMSVEEATEKTKSYLADLRDFAAKTPFELPQTLTAVKRLLSIGYAADDVKDRLLPTIGDIVSALGQPPQSISAVVYAFGQMKSAGRVLTQDLMQIGNALPGFNAKMAIATEMFEGDMDAFNAAMEKGAVASDEAIDAILSAMQKFGGAQGAMIRQSETLAGVMSTFSDTVNNALIDGLMPSIPVLSATLNEVMPAVEGVATAFAQALGPALVDGAQILGEVSPAIADIIPPVIDLVSQLTVMADVFVAFMPVIEGAAKVAGLFASVLDSLPTPVFVAVGAILIMRTALKKLGLDAAGANSKMKMAMLGIKTQVVSATETVRLSLMLSGVSFKAAGMAAGQFARTIAISMRTAATAIRGFMASLGPIGIAIAAVSVAFEVFGGKSAAAEELIAKLRDTTDEATASLNGLNLAAAAEQLRMDLSTEDIKKLQDAGISIMDMATAALSGGEAVSQMEEKILALRNAGDYDFYETVRRNFTGMADNAAEAVRLNEIAAESQREAAVAAGQAEYAQLQSAIASGKVAEAYPVAAKTAEELAEETAAAAEAQQALNETFNVFLDSVSDIKAADAAAAAIRELSKSVKENGTGLVDSGKKAEAFRADVISAIEASANVATRLGETAEEQQQIFAGELVKIVNALRDEGVKRGDIEAFLGELDQLPMSVEDIMQAANIAAGKGAGEVTTKVNENIDEALGAAAPYLTATASLMAQAAADETGRELGLQMDPALSNAIRTASDNTKSVFTSEGNGLGYEITRGVIVGINNGQIPVQDRLRSLARAAIAAAKAELGIASPSKVFLEIGKDLTKGLELGVVRGAPGFNHAMARMWQDAKWAAADARDAVVAAEKALKEARDEGNAREIAAAERDLARARRDAADAAKAARQAEKDLAAVRELASMPFGKAAQKFWDELAKGIADTGDLDAAFAAAEQFLMRRALKAGLSAEAAAEYVSTTLNKFYEATEKDQRRLNVLTGRLENVRDRIERVRREIEERAAERESARAEFGSFFESLFGEESDFEQAYDAYAITIDKAADLFKDLDALIEQRFTGAKDEAERDRLTAFLEDQTKQLVSLIKRRDALAEQLRDGEAKLRAMVDERDKAEERLRDSITSFFKPVSGITSADEYITGLQQRVDATRQYMADIDALRKRGVGASTIEQILSMGPEAGGSLANVLANATDEQLEYVNALTAQSETMASSFGETQAEIMYGAGVKAQQELVNGLRSEYNTVIGEIETIVKAIGDELKPLADESYDVGELMGEQLLEGLLEKEAQIVAEIETIGNRIARAWAQALGMSWRPGGASNRGGMIATPAAVPTTVGGGMQMSFGEIKVEVNVGDGQNTGAVSSAVSSGVADALRQVAQRAANARR